MITYLEDNKSAKPKITYLDEQTPPLVGDLLPKFSVNADLTNPNVINPTDIISGVAPYKAVRNLTGELANRAKVATGASRLSDVPIAPPLKGLLPINPVNIGLNIGTNASRSITPRSVAEGAIDMAATPETYAGMEFVKPGLISKPLEGLASKLEQLAPKAAEDIAPSVGQRGLSILKTGRDYLYDKVAKPVSELVTKTIKESPELARKLGLKTEAIELVGTHGYDKVANVEAADAIAKEAFDAANSQKATVYGDKIDIGDTIDLIKRKFSAIKKTDANNPWGKLYQSWKNLKSAPKGYFEGMPGGLEEEAARTRGLKIPTATEYGRVAAGENFGDISKQARITRDQFSNVREQIDNLYKARVINKGDVMDVINSLYNDAEKSGLKGMQNARELYHQARQFDEVSKNISKAEVFDPAKVYRDILSVAKEPNNYRLMVDKYSPYLGKDTAEKIFNEALASRRGKKIIKAGLTGAGMLTLGKVGYGIFH